MGKRDLRILAVRVDRVGDVVLSTPAFQALKRHYPGACLTVMVREAVAPLVRGLPFVDEVLIFDPEGRHRGLRGFLELVSAIRQRRFRIAVCLQSNWKVAAAIFCAGVRYRVGPLSKPHSYLFYNRGVRQRRSQVEMHEADYNLALLRRLGVRAQTRSIAPRVAISVEAKDFAARWLSEQAFAGDGPLVVVHPAMGGSALNWPDSQYADLIRLLVQHGARVLVTCGPGEGKVSDRIREMLDQKALEGVRFYGGAGTGPIDRLAALLEGARLVVAPSTGPLHIATALGLPVLSFYPPIRVQSAIRWGPYVADDSRASVLVPEVYCGEDFRCRGNLCNYYPCMKGLTVKQAFDEARRLLTSSGASPGASSG